MNSRIPFETIEKLTVHHQDERLIAEISSEAKALKRKIVVLDDDPTGVQTVHDIDVLTQWDREWLREAFRDGRPLFFILTNTRAMNAQDAARVNREIAANVLEVAKEVGYEVEFVSRSDSTLRGHYPLEIDVLSEETASHAGFAYDGHLIVPAFFEAGRFTYQDVHYLKEDEQLTPVHLTEFAKDKVFGFTHSDLKAWVAEKTEGRFTDEQCLSISINQLREGPDAVLPTLLAACGNQPVIVNALSYGDLHVLALALYRARSLGKRFVYRTAASFIKAYAGMADQPYLTGDTMTAEGTEHHGGVVVIGSHTAKTTSQLNRLLQGTDLVPYEMDVGRIMDDREREQELRRLSEQINDRIREGRSVVVFSSRKLLAVDDKEGNLRISGLVSASLVSLVENLAVTPRFIIAKGGITSSDVATKGLLIRKAKVLGQAAAGVPVWQTGAEARFPNIPYIIFPGNVGGENTLLEIVTNITRTRGEQATC